MECPVFPSTRKGVPAGISRISLVIYHAWEGWILTSPLLEQHRVIHSHTTNRDGLKQGTPSPLFGQELNSARAPGGRWRGSGRGSIHPQPSPARDSHSPPCAESPGRKFGWCSSICSWDTTSFQACQG